MSEATLSESALEMISSATMRPDLVRVRGRGKSRRYAQMELYHLSIVSRGRGRGPAAQGGRRHLVAPSIESR